jgi:spore maturation protein CgeB
VTSFCPDGIAAGRLVLDSSVPTRAFYDIDTPRTLADLASHGAAAVGDVQYVNGELIREYDVFLSFTGGPMLRELEERWGVKRALPLYCSVDPEVHRPVAPVDRYACALGYLGSYSHDRQPAVERLLLEPARRKPDDRFEAVMPGTPAEVVWPANVTFRSHLAPPEHAAFYSSNRITLNVTRQAMVRSGYAPSVRLFEASACGAPIVTDRWAGLETFFRPNDEILTADTTDEALEALALSDSELARIARAARERCLAEHTAARRAAELVRYCEQARSVTA